MENKINYQKQMDKIIESNSKSGIIPTVLLHSCCAPCSSYVLEYLSDFFKITVLYYNPNINTDAEYMHRKDEQKRLIEQLPAKYEINFSDCDYNHSEFLEIASGLEDEPERGKRCIKCYRQRLEKTAAIAKEKGFDYFATTLTLSPLKDATAINNIGKALEAQYDTAYLVSDFKKREGYKRSIELSREYNLYRQNFCGCEFSK